MLEPNLNWETGRLLSNLEGFEVLGLAIQRLDFKGIETECDYLLTDLEKGPRRAALTELRDKAREWQS
ncbi:MAG: hypothetical protein M0Q95_12680 [Porticoccaceae bacterium]|nr:hypothetical protein [Porticoccaceae bacterium]